MKKTNIATSLVGLGIAVALGWLLWNLFVPLESRRVALGQICFDHVGPADKPLPRVCATGEARAPHDATSVVVVLTSGELSEFLRVVARQKGIPPDELPPFGAFQVRNSIDLHAHQQVLSRSEMRVVLERLLDHADSEQHASERAALRDLLGRLS